MPTYGLWHMGNGSVDNSTRVSVCRLIFVSLSVFYFIVYKTTLVGKTRQVPTTSTDLTP